MRELLNPLAQDLLHNKYQINGRCYYSKTIVTHRVGVCKAAINGYLKELHDVLKTFQNKDKSDEVSSTRLSSWKPGYL